MIPAQVFSYEVYKIFKNTFFYITAPVAASGSEYIFDLQEKINVGGQTPSYTALTCMFQQKHTNTLIFCPHIVYLFVIKVHIC